MLISPWPRNSKRSAPAGRRHTQTSSRQGAAGFAARLEALEDRCLFSTLTVTSIEDSGAGSLRAQIAAAESGDTIVFASTLTSSTSTSSPTTTSSAPLLKTSAKGTNKGKGNGKPTSPPPPPPPPPTPTITLTSGQLLLTKDLTIQGPGAGQLVISGSSTSGTGSRAFEVAEGSALTLSGLKISGSSDYWASYPVETPWAGYGGGILNHGTLAASGCTFSGYVTVGEGGAIFSDGTLTLSACTVTNSGAGSTTGSGAGISNWGTATLTNTIISNNAAQPSFSLSYPWYNKGGGILNEGTMTLTGCTVSGNSARHAAGGILNAGTLILDRSTVFGNSTGNYGGGISNVGTITVRNSSSVTGNSAPYGADVYTYGVLNLDDTSTIGTLAGYPAILIQPTNGM
jgi:hypothetical protein